MSAPALTVRCGSCKNVINVPANLLERLLEVKRFNCPHCKEGQQINPEVFAKYSSQPLADQVLGKHRLLFQQQSGVSQGRRYGGGLEDRSSWQFDRVIDRESSPKGDEADRPDEEEEHEAGEIFADYRPIKLPFGRPHPDPAVETASLAAVEPPDITYQLHIQDLVEEGKLSGLQLESIVYACQRHDQLLPSGDRCGFFIGDGAGVGKGRTIAGLILENWRCDRKRHLWISIGSDLRVDARRDLNDANGEEIEIHALNKLQYGKLDSDKLGVRSGVVFLSYSSLISGCDNGATRMDQLCEWCGNNFDGLIVFDECHKAKNLVPESGAKPTKVGRMVLELQQRLPHARVVYCSATGASEPRNMGYMERLGLWGNQHPAFPGFADFLEVIGSRGVGALEMVAMDMKARGMYVCRTLSFAGAEFEVVESELEEPLKTQYTAAARMWSQIRREFLYAIEQASSGEEEGPKKGNMLWRFFWAAQQRFFRHLCMAAKVPNLVRMATQALTDGKCCVIGLQSTGEARTQDVVAEKGEELDDFVSGPRELLLKLVEDHYPLPPDPDQTAVQQNGKSGPGGRAGGRGKKRKTEGVQDVLKGRKKAKQKPAGGDLGFEQGSGEGLYAEVENDEAWERMHGSGAAGTSQADSLKTTPHGRKRLEDMREALRRAQQRKAQVKTCTAGLDLPHNPLDMLIDMLGGPEKVAEMTGRKGRLIRMKRDNVGEAGSEKTGVKWEARNASGVGPGATLEMINVHERKLFLGGIKLIAIISEAASAGISLHADKRAVNQRRRVHLTLELPWSADKAIQQFGRSHRANQAHGPQYRLLFTPLGGERRFASSVARRLESLGALTQGDRKAGPSLSAFNYESVWGQRALKRLFRVIMGDELSPIDIPACTVRNGQVVMSESKFLGKARAQLLGVGLIRPAEDAIHVNLYLSQENGAPMGVGKISDADKQDVGRFLNRMLGLDPEWQAYLFDFFQAMLEHIVAEAKRDGRYQDGIVDVKATSVILREPPKVVRMDETTRAPTLLCTIVTDRGVSWVQAQEMLDPIAAAAVQNNVIDLTESPKHSAVPPAATAASRAQNAKGFYRSNNPMPPYNKHAIVLALPQESKQGISWTIVRPNTGRQLKPIPTEQLVTRYRRVNDALAHQMWQETYSESNKFGFGHRLKELHLLSGLVLPIWPEVERVLKQQSRVYERRLNVVRIETTEPTKRRFVGVLLPPQSVEGLLANLRASDPHFSDPTEEIIPLDD